MTWTDIRASTGVSDQTDQVRLAGTFVEHNRREAAIDHKHPKSKGHPIMISGPIPGHGRLDERRQWSSERWFGFLTDQMITRGAHRSVQALERDIRAWITDWNTHPRPFLWTKTAEETVEFNRPIGQTTVSGEPRDNAVPCSP